MIHVQVNGEEFQIDDDATVADLVARLVTPERAVAVEVNQELVPKGQHAQYRLQPGDKVEIVTLVGGG